MVSHPFNLVARYSGPPAHELDNVQQGKGCVPFDPLVDTPYHYIPHLAPGIIFIIINSLALLIHFYYMLKSRKWWYASIWLGALSELMGWAARTASHRCPYNNDAFVLQISILIIAPCFFSAALYYLEAELIKKWGRQHSLLSAKLYLYIFIGADLVSIAVQGTGGGLASASTNKVPPESPDSGTHTMIGGIVVQLVSMSLFSVLLFYTMWSARGIWLTGPNLAPDAGKMKMVLGAALAVDALILARNYYRAVELGGGWDGNLMAHEVWFSVFDAALMALVVIVFSVFPPQLMVKVDKSASPLTGRVESDQQISDSDMEAGEKKPSQDASYGSYQTRI